MDKFDLHTHSNLSDGTLPPKALVAAAKAAGLAMMSLTDHDCILGMAEAMEAGKELGVKVIPGLEIDTEHPAKLHMLGLGIDPVNAEMAAFAEQNVLRRNRRNNAMVEQLEAAGVHILPHMLQSRGAMTRLHVAVALVAGGYAQNINEAFQNYLRPGQAGYVHSPRIEPEAAIALIHRAGGLAVLAHPCKMNCDMHSLVDRLAEAGMDGIEAFYPTATPGQKEGHLSLARQYGLLVSCGSDFHGENRAVSLGDAWEDHPALAPIYERLASAGPQSV